MNRKFKNNFWKKVKIPKDPNACWEWKGAKTSRGYGKVFNKGKTLSAHRVSYRIMVGRIPKGGYICHKCDNRGCVNPEHLELGDRNKNVKDAVERGLMKSKGRLTETARNYIRENPYGLSQRKLAEVYGVSQAKISKIVREGETNDNRRGNGQHG